MTSILHSDASSTSSFELDELGRLIGFTDSQITSPNNEWEFTYNGDLPSTVSFPGAADLQTEFSYNEDLQPTAIVTSTSSGHPYGAGVTLAGDRYSYDEIGKIIGHSRDERAGYGKVYAYGDDALHRLKESYHGVADAHTVTGTPGSSQWRQQYTLDDASGRTNVKDVSSGGSTRYDHAYTATATPGSGSPATAGDSRMKEYWKVDDNGGSIAGSVMLCDANGNMISMDDTGGSGKAGDYVFQYNSKNELVAVYLDNGSTDGEVDGSDTVLLQHWYDCFGRRVATSYGPLFQGHRGTATIGGIGYYYGANSGTIIDTMTVLDSSGGKSPYVVESGSYIQSRPPTKAAYGTLNIPDGDGSNNAGKYWPLVNARGDVTALIDVATQKVVERYDYQDYGTPLIEPIIESGEWDAADTGRSYSGNTTFDFGSSFDVTSDWANKIVRLDVLGDVTELPIIAINTSSETFTVPGNIAEPADGTYFEVIGINVYDVSSTSAAGSDAAQLTTITLASSNGSATDAFVAQQLKVVNSFVSVTVVDSSSTTYKVRGDITNEVTGSSYVGVYPRSSSVGNPFLFVGQLGYHHDGGTLTPDGTTYYRLPDFFYLHHRHQCRSVSGG